MGQMCGIMKSVRKSEKVLATSKIGDKFRVYLAEKVIKKLGLEIGDRLAFVECEDGEIKVFRATEEIKIIRKEKG